MIWPKRYPSWDLIDSELVYKVKDIEPLLNELVRLKADEKPFPSYQDFERDCMLSTKTDWNRHIMYNYFSQFCYETKVFPKVGDMVEGEDKYQDGVQRRGEIDSFNIYDDVREEMFEVKNIRPVTRPTREEVIAKYGLTDSDVKALGVNNDLRTWIIENAEDVTGQDGVKWNAIDRDEILNYLKGQDDDI